MAASQASLLATVRFLLAELNCLAERLTSNNVCSVRFDRAVRDQIPSSVTKSESGIDAAHEVAALEATFLCNEFTEGMMIIGLILRGMEKIVKNFGQAIDRQLIRPNAENSIARPKESPFIVDSMLYRKVCLIVKRARADQHDKILSHFSLFLQLITLTAG